MIKRQERKDEGIFEARSVDGFLTPAWCTGGQQGEELNGAAGAPCGSA